MWPEAWSDLPALLSNLLSQHPSLVYAALGLSAAIEYVFPPFPGDTVTLAGAVLVAAYKWSLPGVLAIVTMGSMAGAAIDYEVGRRWAARRSRRARSDHSEAPSGVDRVVAVLQERGSWYIVVNRFLPGIRAFFFVAAGLAGLPFWHVMLWGLLSALAWNAMLMGVGFALGLHLAELEAWIGAYTRWALAIAAAAALAGTLWWWLRRRKASRAARIGRKADEKTP